MRAEEALNLAQRVANRWRGTASIETWADALAALDHQHSLATFIHFAKTTQDPGPSIKQFCDRLELDHPTQRDDGSCISRDQAIAVMTAAGAKPHMLTKRRDK